MPNAWRLHKIVEKRDLVRLVDDPHPAPADLPEDAAVAEEWRRGFLLWLGGWAGSAACAGPRRVRTAG